MIDFKELINYFFAIITVIIFPLTGMIWHNLISRVKKIEDNQTTKEIIDAKIASVKGDINLEILKITSSLDSFIQRMDDRHERFEKVEKKFETFLDSRKDLHDQLSRMSQAIGTKEEMMRTLNALESINLKINLK